LYVDVACMAGLALHLHIPDWYCVVCVHSVISSLIPAAG
jgi:hypothetical protein